MYTLEKAERKPLAQRTEDDLKEYILKTPVAIGERMPGEHELARMFGVGRSTIRETIKSLVTQGILEVRRGSGTYVVSLNKSENDPLGLHCYESDPKLGLELFEVRLMLEPEIAALAAERATEEEKKKIRALCDETEECIRQGVNHLPTDCRFHSMIAHCSGNRVAEALLPLIQDAVYTFGEITKRKLMKETVETHRAITEAIEKGDIVGARCAMVMHLTYNRQMMLKIMNHEIKDI